MLEKGDKQDLSLVKSYRVISLLNCLGKIVEKVIAGLLSKYYEKFCKLHQGQMGAQKHKCAIDKVASLVHKVQELWEEKKLAVALFIDIKKAFDHVSRIRLVEKMIELGVNGDMIR